MRPQNSDTITTVTSWSWFSAWGACLIGGVFLFLACSAMGGSSIIFHPVPPQVRFLGPLTGQHAFAGGGIVVGWAIHVGKMTAAQEDTQTAIAIQVHAALIGPFPSMSAIKTAREPGGAPVDHPIAVSSPTLLVRARNQTITSTLYLSYEQIPGDYDLVQTASITLVMSRTTTSSQTIIHVDPLRE